ncbi:hypothetical protein [Phenylobacterium zucineum]|uniref:hypothetical protein n=1 Tax=Phenylobacterium zucineum TaxID=284016 RepID=UPI0002DCB323|nr:hypothetical protein [Phenylobacterium zucineum]
MRTAGLFAFARRPPSGAYEVLHLGLSAAINREADAGHPRWEWAMRAGMDSLLVHLFGKPAEIPAGAPADLETVTWQPRAEVAFLQDGGDGLDQDLASALALRRS